jgi:hypothetical protein
LVERAAGFLCLSSSTNVGLFGEGPMASSWEYQPRRGRFHETNGRLSFGRKCDPHGFFKYCYNVRRRGRMLTNSAIFCPIGTSAGTPVAPMGRRPVLLSAACPAAVPDFRVNSLESEPLVCLLACHARCILRRWKQAAYQHVPTRTNTYQQAPAVPLLRPRCDLLLLHTYCHNVLCSVYISTFWPYLTST